MSAGDGKLRDGMTIVGTIRARLFGFELLDFDFYGFVSIEERPASRNPAAKIYSE